MINKENNDQVRNIKQMGELLSQDDNVAQIIDKKHSKIQKPERIGVEPP